MKSLRENLHILKWLNSTIKGKRYFVVVLAVLSGMVSVIALEYALLFRSLIDRAVAGDMQGLFHSALMVAGAFLIQIALRTLYRYFEESGKTKIENSLKSRLFHNLLVKNYADINAVHSGEWMNRLTSDAKIVADDIIYIFPALTGMLIRLIGGIIILLMLQPGFAVILIPGGIIVVAVTFLFRGKLKSLHKAIQEKDGELRVFFQEHLSSMMVLRAFGREEKTEQQAKTYMDAHRTARMKRNAFSNLCNVGFNLIMNGLYIGSAIYCAYGIASGTISFGTMTAILQLVSQVQGPFANLSGLVPTFYAMLASAERIKETEDYQTDISEPARTQDEVLSFYKDSFSSIELKHISFSYPARNDTEEEESSFAVTDCSISIPKGKYIGVTGPSGCGKSSLFKLLMAFYSPQEGERNISSTQGEIPLDSSWRGLFAYVPQGNYLMKGTIRQAVTMTDGVDPGQEEKLKTALYTACAEDFVSQLPQGVDTELGEHGGGLSEGQIQRLAIARAIYSDRPILLLDEATASLDENTEKELLIRLRKMSEKTLLIITHRKAALSITDRIVECSINDGIVSWKECQK